MKQPSLARKLRVLRAERGLSLSGAVEGMGIGQDTLAELERGKRQPNAQTLHKIAKGYGIPVTDLMDLMDLVDLVEEEPGGEHAARGKAQGPPSGGSPFERAVEEGGGGRDAHAFQRALVILIRETRKAWLRNGEKKDPRLEGSDFWLDKLDEEVTELREAWLDEDKVLFFAELGDVGNSLVGLMLQGAYDLLEKERGEGAKT